MIWRAPEPTGALTFVTAVIITPRSFGVTDDFPSQARVVTARSVTRDRVSDSDAVLESSGALLVLESAPTSSCPLHCTWLLSSATDIGWLS